MERAVRASRARKTLPLAQTQPSLAQDIVLGVVLPWAMLALDRSLFSGFGLSPFPGSILGDWRPAAYTGTAFFTTVLCFGRAVGRAPGVHAGILGAGALFAIVVGLCLLPLSLLGLLAGIGLLGLSPFIVAWPYLRGARTAWKSSPARPWVAAFLGFVLALGLPLGAQLGAERAFGHALLQLRSDDPVARAQGARTFRWLRHLRGLDGLVQEYEGAKEAGERERLGESFRQITGWDIEQWLAFRAD